MITAAEALAKTNKANNLEKTLDAISTQIQNQSLKGLYNLDFIIPISTFRNSVMLELRSLGYSCTIFEKSIIISWSPKSN